jgi:hypothetical protein
MSRYDRFALIVDPEGAGLGVEALGLIERGIDPLFAKDLDEVVLLARQEEERVGALVVPGTLPLASLDAMLESVAPRLWAGPAAVLIVAPPRERATLRALRDRGIRWVLHAPYDSSELRFAVAAALATEDDLDPRSGLRVPIRLHVDVQTAGTRGEGWIRNLSIGGAYIALEQPPEVEAELELSLHLGERPLRVEAQARHRLAAPLPGRAEREPGVGVAFRPLEPADQRHLAAFIKERIGSFRI